MPYIARTNPNTKFKFISKSNIFLLWGRINTVYCQKFGNELTENANFCTIYGVSLKTPQIQKSFGEKNCPKCGNKLEKDSTIGSLTGPTEPEGKITIVKKGYWVGDKIIPFYCKNCGYIELFIEKFLTSP
jgi:predicted nucleic-acid-binding Zn-ribbon protein